MGKQDRLTIITGTDRSPLVRIRNPQTGDPLDLTEATKIQFEFEKRDRTKMIIDDTTIPAVKAQITEEDSEIVFIASTAGANGNDIILQFNGVDTVDEVITVWNNANPTNTVAHNGTGTEVITTQTLRLTDGRDAYTPVEISGDPQLGKVILRLVESDTMLLKRGPNQSFTAIIDFGTNPGGTRIKGFYPKLDVLDA